MTADDDEFVARTGRLWRWIDDAADTGMRVGITAYFVLIAAGLPWWIAGPLPLAAVVAVTQTAIVRERRRLFPKEDDA